ncbi:MAG: hypothetical protein L3K19_08320 [Thermoplasmata archaeon]|nr:hypothetical protein [Thermoplasmata archaeon]
MPHSAMGWGGIQNVPPGFDVFGGKQGASNIVEDAIKGRVVGLSSAREGMFVDLKRNLLHRDYARYFDSCLPCAAVLGEIADGKYEPEILRDIVEPALAVALGEMESIRKDAARSQAAKRKMEYDAQSSLDMLLRKAKPIALAYPNATGSKDLEAKFREISDSVREMGASAASKA